jgi:hypothetical protein
MKSPYTLYKNSALLLSDVAIPRLPKEIIFEGQKLFVKDEFHITLVGARSLASKIDPENQNSIKDQILREFNKFVETTPLEDYKILEELCFVHTDKEKTIIVMAEVPGLDKFFDHLSQKFSVQLPKQQTHVTLYRYPKDFIGVPIPSAEVLESASKIVKLPEIEDKLFYFSKVG